MGLASPGVSQSPLQFFCMAASLAAASSSKCTTSSHPFTETAFKSALKSTATLPRNPAVFATFFGAARRRTLFDSRGGLVALRLQVVGFQGSHRGSFRRFGDCVALRVVRSANFIRDLGRGRQLLRVQRGQLHLILEHTFASAASVDAPGDRQRYQGGYGDRQP